MRLPSSIEAIILSANQNQLYSKLIIQLNKDFQLANSDVNFETDISALDLKKILHETIYDLIQNKFSDYLNLLYIIDVSEGKVKQLDGSDILVLSEQVTFLILQREWQKVWYRNQY